MYVKISWNVRHGLAYVDGKKKCPTCGCSRKVFRITEAGRLSLRQAPWNQMGNVLTNKRYNK